MAHGWAAGHGPWRLDRRAAAGRCIAGAGPCSQGPGATEARGTADAGTGKDRNAGTKDLPRSGIETNFFLQIHENYMHYIYIHPYIFMYIDEQVNTRMAFRKYLDCIYSQ